MIPKTEDKPKRTTPDYSPENDLKKAVLLLASARSKLIRHRDETKASAVLELIQKAEALSGVVA